MSQNPGCLGALFPWLFGSRPAEPQFELPGALPQLLPYRLRDDFLSRAEASFFHVLRQAVGDAAVVCPKVRLSDLFFVPRPHENRGARNRIDGKHVDFVLCDPLTLRPLLGIELDDATHGRADRQRRDALLDGAFAAAGLRLVRIPVQAAYELGALRELLALSPPALTTQQAEPPLLMASGVPQCPRCEVPMVERRASRGANAGQTFFGCPNYPRCRNTAP